MTVVSEGPLCLKIHLNKFELKKYFTSYDKISFQDPQVKKTISCLFDAAISGLTFETSGKRIIEVFPTASGGCILKFTTEPLPALPNEITAAGRSVRLKSRSKDAGSYVFAFADFEALLSAVEMLYATPYAKQYRSSVYHTRRRYYLHIHIPLFDRKSALQISEFSDFSARGETALGLLQEHARLIAEANAIAQLGAAFFKAI